MFKACLEHLAEAFWRKILFSKFTLGMSRKKKKKKCSHSHENVMPGPRPRSRSFGVEHYQLFWLYTAGTDQVTNYLRACIRSLHLQSLCVGNGRRERLVWTPSSQDLGLPPLTVFVQLITTFYACPNYWILSAITIST